MDSRSIQLFTAVALALCLVSSIVTGALVHQQNRDLATVAYAFKQLRKDVDSLEKR